MTNTASSLPYLREICKLYPSADAVLARIAVLSATLTLPKGSVHIISDVHGEDKKLRHVVNNASGNLRPLVQALFKDKLSESEQLRLLSFIYYPRESYTFHLEAQDLDTARPIITQLVSAELELIRLLARRYPLETTARLLPHQYIRLFRELILGPQFERSPEHFYALIESFLSHKKALELLRFAARLVRNLAVSELIVAGDLGDRGPRIDKVIEFLTHQPDVRFTWGNHDTTWMGACLGHDACIASVLRISLKHGRLAQLEDGYGISLEPLRLLAEKYYKDDPCTNFTCKNTEGRNVAVLAQMHKAAAILQFKLESEVISRNPHYNLRERDLLSQIDIATGSLTLSNKLYELSDKRLPTCLQDNPSQLNDDELACLSALRESFLQSAQLWKHMQFLRKNGSMVLERDGTLVFHGCVPVNADGGFAQFLIDGHNYSGTELFRTIERVVHRSFEEKLSADLDLLWYLWCGPLSPLFGKDKISTFEQYFITDTETHHEEKNPYFSLIHEKDFCTRVLSEFGVTAAHGLIVNGHVPVKIEAGESPIKRSKMAITIDGAFSEAYGDKGYTLILEAEKSSLALHHHFESVEDSILNGTDMVPSITVIREFSPERKVLDTEQGVGIQDEISVLEEVMEGYLGNRI